MNWWKSFRHKLHTAGQLSLADWLCLAAAWWALVGFRLALLRLSYERLEAFTSPVRAASMPPADFPAQASRRQKLVSLAARLHLVSMTCLPRALTLRWLLGRAGIPSHLRIGMARSAARLYAHAWVEVSGQAIGEPEDIPARFRVLTSSG